MFDTIGHPPHLDITFCTSYYHRYVFIVMLFVRGNTEHKYLDKIKYNYIITILRKYICTYNIKFTALS